MKEILKIIGKKGSKEILDALKREDEEYYSDLEEELGLNSRTLTRRLAELEEIGLLERQVLDNRRVNYHLTLKGEKVKEKIQELVEIIGEQD